MTRIFAAAAAIVFVACSARTEEPLACTDCIPGDGGVRIALSVSPSSVARVTATVTAPDLAAAIAQELTISGNPPVANGTIANVAAGTNRLVTLEAYAAAPEDTLVIYRGSVTTNVQAGQLSQVSITLLPVMQDVSVTATFPSGDVDVASVHHVAVTVSGARITGSATWYLSLDAAQGTAGGTASAIPVGASRTVTVQAFDAGGVLLHAGSAVTSVVEAANNAVTVALANQGGDGSIGVGGGFCEPSCTGKVCGDDGCGGSCGGCQPGFTCAAGACGATQAAWTTVLTIPENPKSVWGTGPSDVWVAGGFNVRRWNGSTWSTTNTGGTSVDAIWGSGPSDVWAAGVQCQPVGVGCGPGSAIGSIVHWDGNAWSGLTFGAQRFNAIWGSGPSDVWAAGSGSSDALHWNGSAWSSVPLGTTNLVNGIWGSAPDDVWAVGQTGTVLHWNGNSWSDHSVATTTYLWNVWGSGASDVWAVGNDSVSGAGLVLHWDGSSWSTVQLGNYPFYSIWGSGPSDVWAGSGHAAGGNGIHWNGTVWSTVPIVANVDVWHLWGSGPNDVWGVGWDPTGLGTGVILHYGP